MMRRFPLGQHELRIFALEPVLFYVRFVGDLTAAQARALVRLLGRELGGGGPRFLVDASALGAIGINPGDLDRQVRVTRGQGRTHAVALACPLRHERKNANCRGFVDNFDHNGEKFLLLGYADRVGADASRPEE